MTKKVVYVITAVLVLSLFSSKLASAQTAEEQLNAIKEGIPASWWEGGWDKLSELQFFISQYSGEPVLCAEAQFYIGCYYYGSRRFQEAIEAYQKLLTTYPAAQEERSWAEFEIGQIYFRSLNDIPKGITAYRKLIADYPEDTMAALAQVSLGECYHYQEDYAAALLEYQKVLDNYPHAQTQCVEASLFMGDIYIREGFSAASEGDKKAKTNHALSAYKKAYLACPIEKPELIECIMDKIYDTFKKLDGSMVRANQFIKYQKYGSPGEDKALGSSDDITDPLTNGKENFLKQLSQKEFDALLLEAYLSDKLGEEAEVKANYEKLITGYTLILNEPDSTKKEKLKALKEITKIKTKQNEFEDIIRLCRDLLCEYPKELAILNIEAEMYHLHANYYLSQGQLDASINKYETILNLDNLSEEWYAFSKDYLAHLYLLKGDPEGTLYWYNRIIEDHPNLKNWPASAHYSIAEYYLRQDEIEKAKEELQMIITEHPESAWVNPAKKKLRSLE